MNYTDRLRSLAIDDDRNIESQDADASFALDPKSLALVQLAALIAVGGEVPSYGARADAAIEAGASVPEIVEVLASVRLIVGQPRVVAAAPRLALALGYDLEDDLAQ